MSESSKIKMIPTDLKTNTFETTICQLRQDLTDSEYEAYLEDLLDINVPPELGLKGKPELFIHSSTPVNSLLRGTFKQSTAYHEMTERVPVILTKLIDYIARENDRIRANYNASKGELKVAIKYVTKLKNEVVTNKPFTLLKEKSIEAEKWNECIKNADAPQYFTCIAIFSQCYIYRKLREPFALSRTIRNFDVFGYQKEEAFKDKIEHMCLVANRLSEMVTETDRDKKRQNFTLLLKLCLWANKRDLSPNDSTVNNSTLDPIVHINELNKNILVDDSAKVVDVIFSRLDHNTINTNGNNTNGVEARELIFDVVCNNAAYEFFTDLCLAYFLINLKIVYRVRFHVKQIPWFVFDTTPKDVQYVINGCKTASFTKEIDSSFLKNAETEAKKMKSTHHPLNSDQLNIFGRKCEEYIKEGTILIESDDYWTSPCLYKDMKTIDPRLYKKLQRPVAILFKGDVNYRKLVGEKNWRPTTDFETVLQGFHPAPIIATRCVKSEIICGLTPAAVEKTEKFNPKWMEMGEFSVIQFSGKCDTEHQEQSQ